jgi:hypothetical protein
MLCYTNITLYIYIYICSVRCYPRFLATAVDLGAYYPWIRGTTQFLSKICCSTSISKSVPMQDGADTSGSYFGLQNQRYAGKVRYPASVLLVRDCVRLCEMMTFSILLQLKEFSKQLLRPKLQSTACESSLDFTLSHTVRRSKVSGKVSHVALEPESYAVAVSSKSSKHVREGNLFC